MKVIFSHYVVPSLLSRSPVRTRRLGLGFHEPAMAALSGSRQPDPDLLLEHSSLKQEHQQRKIEEEEEAEAAGGELEEKKGADEIDEDQLKKQLGEPPEKPLPGDCCGSGCVRCVWDIYYEELEIYNSRKAALEAGHSSR